MTLHTVVRPRLRRPDSDEAVKSIQLLRRKVQLCRSPGASDWTCHLCRQVDDGGASQYLRRGVTATDNFNLLLEGEGSRS